MTATQPLTAAPMVSVILTSFNHANFLREAIESVLNQSYTNFELIIWDDCSSDESDSIINSFTDHRIKYFRNDINKGPTFGVNEAIFKYCAAKYIAIHHSDDVWLPHKLAEQVSFLETNSEVGAVFSFADAISETGEKLPAGSHFYTSIFQQPNRQRREWLRHFLLHGNALCHPSVLVRKACYEAVGGYRTDLFQLPDFDMWIRICSRYDIHILQKSLMQFRVLDNERNTSGNRLDSRRRSAFERMRILSTFKENLTAEDLKLMFPELIAKFPSKINEHSGLILARILAEIDPFEYADLFVINEISDFLSSQPNTLSFDEHWPTLKDLHSISGNYDSADYKYKEALRDGDRALAFTQAKLEEVKARYSAAADELKNTITYLKNTEKTLDDIYNSSSWLLTAPLRWSKNQARRAVLLYQAFALGRKKLGGILPVFNFAWSVLQNDGLGGIKHIATTQLAQHKATHPNVNESFEHPANGQTEILFVSHEATRTGAPVLLLSIAKSLKDTLGISCVFLLCRGGEIASNFKALGTTYVLNDDKKIDSITFKKLKRRNIKLVYANTSSNGLVQVQLKAMGHPIICHIHELGHSIERHFGGKNFAAIQSSTDFFLAGSGVVANYLTDKCGISADKVTTAYPFIDVTANLDIKANCPNPLGKPKGTITIGACGTIGWRKGTDVFLQVANYVLNKTTDIVHFVWVGGPLNHGDYPNIKYDAETLKIANQITFPGAVSNHIAYMSQFDVLILPSREDPFPLVVLDAASLSIPVVCFESAGGAPEFVEDDAGSVVPYLDVALMGDSIIELIRNANKRKSLGKTAFTKVMARHDIHSGSQVITTTVSNFLNKGTSCDSL